VQGVEHRLAGDPDQPAEGLVQLQDQEDGAETARAETTKAKIVVAFGGASTLKPRKITTSQETRMISIGSEMEGTTCATSSDRSWPRSVAMVVASQRSVTPPKTTFPKWASYYLPDRLPHEQRVTTCVVAALRVGRETQSRK
jgi:hypothetical protein